MAKTRLQPRWYYPRSLLLFGGRCASSPATIGLLLSLYGLSTHYVSSLRKYAPFKINDWLDAKSQIGNVFYSAFLNSWEFFPNVFTGQFSSAITNLTNMAGIRSEVYARVIHSNAINNAEAFTRSAPWIILALFLFRIALYGLSHYRSVGQLWTRSCSFLRFKKRPPTQKGAPGKKGSHKRIAFSKELRFLHSTIDGSLIYLAQICIASAALTAVFINTVEYYQGLSGVTGLIGRFGSGLATAIDYVSATSSYVFNELIWHGLFMMTEGKEKAIGWFTQDKNLEYVSHYLAKMPASKIPDALHTAIYQAILAGVLWSIAHFYQKHLARIFARQLDALPPHMKRYLANRKR